LHNCLNPNVTFLHTPANTDIEIDDSRPHTEGIKDLGAQIINLMLEKKTEKRKTHTY